MRKARTSVSKGNTMEDPKAFVVVLVSNVVGMVARDIEKDVVGYDAMASVSLVRRMGIIETVGRTPPRNTLFLAASDIEDLPSFLVGYSLEMDTRVDTP